MRVGGESVRPVLKNHLGSDNTGDSPVRIISGRQVNQINESSVSQQEEQTCRLTSNYVILLVSELKPGSVRVDILSNVPFAKVTKCCF